ncbi:ABC transporter substrate-binding protein [Pseudomonas vancouverensis]|uniref:ABC transporter substrate-binding protein n=1 Tax=Pseudomonas vancouverensis TaxID=95300 RepID=A0A1H2NN33_PSEVA|nr:ABC transporter substrate-binding protein [Pseudomonas vancouverensis]KAB0495346.1 ABC transporter substrate-binding protein [Pseudomonas vancouverensis]TDB62419.1 ABC transporter substrate-binding protein [Pseudomonas vancouverensis]SDV06907.1 putative spermidine/putrescine transport system substrate-binding protein [Pseudomonas vancouverensis]
MKRFNKNLLKGAVVAALTLGTSAAVLADSLTFSGWGGAQQDAERKAYLQPAAKALGIVIKEDNMDGLAAVRAQVMSGKPKWDVVELGSTECAQAQQEGLVEPLDYSVIDATHVDKNVVSSHWIASHAYATVVAWAEGSDAPVAKNWQQFFDPQVKGARALYRQPWLTMEAALLGDGVAAKDLYPLDVERAIKVLSRIKPQVVNWWSAGADSAQLLRSREVDFLAIWNGRVNEVKASGDAVDYSFDGALLSHDCLIVPKGSANKALAMKLIAEIIKPQSQATLATLIPYSPVNAQAYELPMITQELAARLPTSPQNIDKVVSVSPQWWVENQEAVRQRFALFLAN